MSLKWYRNASIWTWISKKAVWRQCIFGCWPPTVPAKIRLHHQACWTPVHPPDSAWYPQLSAGHNRSVQPFEIHTDLDFFAILYCHNHFGAPHSWFCDWRYYSLIYHSLKFHRGNISHTPSETVKICAPVSILIIARPPHSSNLTNHTLVLSTQWPEKI